MKNVLVGGGWWGRHLSYLIVCFITNITSRKLGNRIGTRLLFGTVEENIRYFSSRCRPRRGKIVRCATFFSCILITIFKDAHRLNC